MHNNTYFTIKDAFKKDIEIMFGYICMGFIFGILLKTSGYSVIYAIIMSIFIYSGVMQFMAISFFLGEFSLSNIFITTLIINIRQSFYTIIMLEQFRLMDKKRFLNIFWLTDETFALINTKKPNKEYNKELFIFFIGMLNHIYWVIGCVSGALFGKLITIDTRGIEFIMTAIFVVIFIDQWMHNKNHFSAIIGILIAIIWLLLIGQTYFLLTSIITCIIIFLFIKKEKCDGL